MLMALLSKQEGKQLEFKENIKSPSGILKTIVAFANTAGGQIIIGVRDKDRAVIGIENIFQEEERIANLVVDSIAPIIMPNIDIITFDNKELIIINVPYLTGPYYLRKSGPQHGTYIRLGSTNRLADSETLSNLYRLQKNITFDELPCLKAKIGELDEIYMKKILSSVFGKFSKVHYKSLGISCANGNRDYASNGGILLFGKDRLKWLPDSMIRCVCFAGNTRNVILDHKNISSPLIDAIDEILIFIRRHTNISAHFSGAARRLDVPQYPPFAVRESVVNAIVHADYSMKGGAIQIAVFSDRLEITNPGGLPFGQTIEEALSGISRMRNRVIGRIFRELNIIEHLGTGLIRIMESYKGIPAPQPKIEEQGTHFRVTLYEVPQPSVEMHPWETQLLQLLSSGSQLSAKQIAKIWKVTDRTARNRLNHMLENHLIVRNAESVNDPNTTYSKA